MDMLIKVICQVTAMLFFARATMALKCYECQDGSDSSSCRTGSYREITCPVVHEGKEPGAKQVCFGSVKSSDGTIQSFSRGCISKGICERECSPQTDESPNGDVCMDCISCTSDLCNGSQSLGVGSSVVVGLAMLLSYMYIIQ
ncbi:uncharacterized protein LOC144441499 isoform X2 [Glandiceps talaboti]